MLSSRAMLCAAAVVVLAACGGSGALPPPAAGPGSGLVASQSATLWVGYDLAIQAFPTDGNGAVPPEQTFGTWSWSSAPIGGFGSDSGITDLAIAPDGTRWVLEQSNFALGGPGWRLFAFGPNDGTPRNAYGDNVASPNGLAAGRDGIIVGYSTNGVTIATYPYSAGVFAPIRTLHIAAAVSRFAEGSDGNLYVGLRDGGIDVYQPTSTGYDKIRTIAFDPQLGTFRLGPDNSIYVPVLSLSAGHQVLYVNVYAPGSSTVARRLGPLPVHFDGLVFPTIVVDSQNRLYVATAGSIYRFGPGANGADNPQNVMTFPPEHPSPRAMAIGPQL